MIMAYKHTIKPKLLFMFFTITLLICNHQSALIERSASPIESNAHKLKSVDRINEEHDSTRSPIHDPYLECLEDTVKTAYPMDLVKFNCTIRNEGNITDDYKALSSTIQGWDIILYPDEFENVPPLTSNASDSDKNRSLSVHIVVGDQKNATAGDYTIEVSLLSQFSPANKCSLNLTLRILPLHGIDIMPPIPQCSLPGEEVVYEFQLLNYGNGDDVYDIWAETSNYNWVAVLENNDQSQIQIPRGGTVIVSVIVFVPLDVDMNTTQITTLCVRAKGDGVILRGFVQTIVRHIWIITVDQSEFEHKSSLECIPGKNVTFSFSIMNEGIELDDVIGKPGTFNISESPIVPAEWETWLDTSYIGSEGLPQEIEVNIYFKVKVPLLTPPGEYHFTIDIYSGDPLKWQDEAEFSVIIPAYPPTIIGFTNFSQEAYPGENVCFCFNLSNHCGYDQECTMLIESDYEAWTYMPEDHILLFFGDVYEISFYVDIPPYTVPGTYDFLFKYNLMDKSTICHTFQVIVLETIDFSFSTSNKFIKAMVGNERSIDLEVNNSGNSDLPLSIEIIGEPWGSLPQSQINIPYNGIKELQFLLKPPTGAVPGIYMFTIIGTATKDSSICRNITLNIHLIKYEFACTNIYVDGGVPLSNYTFYTNETVHFYVEVLNTGLQHFDSALFGEDITVMVYRGGDLISIQKISAVQTDLPVRIDYNSTFPKEGKYTFTVRINGDRLLYESDFNDNDAMLEINVKNKETPVDNDDDDGWKDQENKDTSIYIMAGIIFLIFICSLIGIVIAVLRKRKNEDKGEDDELGRTCPEE